MCHRLRGCSFVPVPSKQDEQVRMTDDTAATDFDAAQLTGTDEFPDFGFANADQLGDFGN